MSSLAFFLQKKTSSECFVLESRLKPNTTRICNSLVRSWACIIKLITNEMNSDMTVVQINCNGQITDFLNQFLRSQCQMLLDSLRKTTISPLRPFLRSYGHFSVVTAISPQLLPFQCFKTQNQVSRSYVHKLRRKLFYYSGRCCVHVNIM